MRAEFATGVKHDRSGVCVVAVRGGSKPAAPPEPHIPAEEALCPIVSHGLVNPEYKHLVVEASPKALAVKPGQFFNLLCPSPTRASCGCAARSASTASTASTGAVEFLYKCVGRGTRGLAAARARRQAQYGRAAGRRLHHRSGLGTYVVLGRGVGIATLGPISQLAGENGAGVTAILSARSAEFVMADDLFREAGDVVSVLDSDGSSAVETSSASCRS